MGRVLTLLGMGFEGPEVSTMNDKNQRVHVEVFAVVLRNETGLMGAGLLFLSF